MRLSHTQPLSMMEWESWSMLRKSAKKRQISLCSFQVLMKLRDASTDLSERWKVQRSFSAEGVL